MAISQEQRTELLTLLVGMFDAAPTSDLLEELAKGLEAGATLESYAHNLATKTEFTDIYPSFLTAQDFAERFVANLLGDNVSEDTTAEAEAFVANAVNAGGSFGDVIYQSLVALSSVPEDDATWGAAVAELNNKVEVAEYFALDDSYVGLSIEQMSSVTDGITSDDATVAEKKVAIDNNSLFGGSTTDGDTTKFELTATNDRGPAFVGTSGSDLYEAYLSQNPVSGGLSNSLSSADRLDGRGGNDTLVAELVPEFFSMNGEAGNRLDVQPTTVSIENVFIEARDAGFGGDATTITLDAKKMSDVEVIGSRNSDGDLIIENLTTSSSTGGNRNTEVITVTMDHTDNFNSDSDASDLTVYFDEDYLLAGQTQGASEAYYFLLDQDSTDYQNSPLLNIDRTGLIFELEGQTFSIEMDVDTLVATNDRESYAEVIQTLINDRVANGETILEGLQVSVDESIQDSTYNDAGDIVQIPAIKIVDVNGRDIVPTGYEIPDALTGEFNVFGRFDNEGAVATQDDITVNVELTKVGREGEGGNLLVGGKSLDADEGNGVEVINVSVLGHNTKAGDNTNSNLGQIASTNGALKLVTITSAQPGVDGTYANLTVRGETSESGVSADPFGETQANNSIIIDADGYDGISAFMGDLTIGNETIENDNGIDSRADSVASLNANIVGDVTYYGDSTENIVTGSGNDYVNEINSSAQINTNAGDDMITVTVASSVEIDAGADNDVVTLSDASGGNFASAEVMLGSGNDVLSSNDVDVTVDSGAGDDVSYLENTGSKGSGSVDLSKDVGTNLDGQEDNDDNGVHLLYGRTVTVTFNADQGVNDGDVAAYTDGFEATATIRSESLEGYTYLTNQADLDAAIQEAIQNSDVLSQLVSYEGGVFTSLIDGNDNQVEVTVSATDWTTAQQAAIENEFQEYVDYSDANVESSYAEYKVVADLLGGTDSVDSTDNTAIIAAGNDVVALSTDSTSRDTLVFTNADFGTTYVTNFDANDRLDFTAWLNNEESTSGSTVSEEYIDRTVGTDLELKANELTVVEFNDVANVDNFDALSESNLLDVFNFTTASYTNSATNKGLVGGTGHSVVMVENDDNAGEYKVFYVDFNGTSDSFELSDSNVDYKGIVDFGASNEINESILALESADSSTEDGTGGNTGGDNGGGNVSFTEVDLDTLGGSNAVQVVAPSAANDEVNYTDALATASNSSITGFGSDDQITLVGVVAADVTVQVSGGNTQIEFDDGQGTVSQIELVGVDDGFFDSVAAFNAASQYGDIVFA